ncbi:MAG: glutaminase [Bacteroidota bacterium]
MDYKRVIDEIEKEIKQYIGHGKVADYIPALARVNADKFGMAIKCVDGDEFVIGDALEPFSIQSISKAFMLTLAIKYVGEDLWQRVGREPSGNRFNSLIQLEYEQGLPRNPFINAGAHVVTDCVLSNCNGPQSTKETLLNFLRTHSGNPEVKFDKEVAQSEKDTGFRNEALANFLKSFGRIENDVHEMLDVYYNQCSVSMSCLELCRAGSYLANGGKSVVDNSQVVSESQAKRINSLMLTCGLYDAVGEFAFCVGLPGKSGVGGGILAIIPGHLSICVWSPGLDESGNSYAGKKGLELFTSKAGLSVF